MRVVFAGMFLILVLLSGCRDHAGIRARYDREKLLWNAQLLERRINLAFLRGSREDLAAAISAFERVLDGGSARYDAKLIVDDKARADIRKIESVSRVALATLYFLEKRYHDAGEMYRVAATGRWPTPVGLDLQMSRLRSLYLAGDADSLCAEGERMLAHIESTSSFWRPTNPLGDVYLNVPLVLAQQYIETERDDDFARVARRAERIYTRARSTWPDSAVAASASIARMNLRMMAQDWRGALEAIDIVRDDRFAAPMRAELGLIRCEILAWGIGDAALAKVELRRLAAEFPGSRAAAAAIFDLSVLELDAGESKIAVGRLRELEENDAVDPTIRARAMLVRARHLESSDRWDEAIVVLRRITGLFPDTEAAMETPLTITRHYIASGDQELAAQSLARARDYYLARIQRGGNRAVASWEFTDAMIETYLTAGEAGTIASLLEKESSRWGGSHAAGAMLRSAAIYSDVLDDREQARRVLEKCIEMYPETRYSKRARREMDRLGTDTESPTGNP